MSLVENLPPAVRKATGSHYTPVTLAKFVAKQIAARLTTSTPRVLDPACGDGALLIALKEQLPGALLHGYDLDAPAIENVAIVFTDAGLPNATEPGPLTLLHVFVRVLPVGSPS